MANFAAELQVFFLFKMLNWTCNGTCFSTIVKVICAPILKLTIALCLSVNTRFSSHFQLLAIGRWHHQWLGSFLLYNCLSNLILSEGSSGWAWIYIRVFFLRVVVRVYLPLQLLIDHRLQDKTSFSYTKFDSFHRWRFVGDSKRDYCLPCLKIRINIDMS